jgi:hypothetical protein
MAVALLLGAAALAAPAARGANADEVTYVDSVDCTAGACEVRRKTEPVERMMRERYSGGVCIEYTRRIAGLRKVPSRDPQTPLEVPQYEDSRPRHIGCDQKAAADAPRVLAIAQTRQ